MSHYISQYFKTDKSKTDVQSSQKPSFAGIVRAKQNAWGRRTGMTVGLFGIGLVGMVSVSLSAHADDLSMLIANDGNVSSVIYANSSIPLLSSSPTTHAQPTTLSATQNQPATSAIGNGVGVISSNSRTTIKRIQSSKPSQPAVYRTPILQPTAVHNSSVNSSDNSINDAINTTPTISQNYAVRQTYSFNQAPNLSQNSSETQSVQIQNTTTPNFTLVEPITTTNSVTVKKPSTPTPIKPLVQQQTLTYSATTPDSIAAHIQRLEKRNPPNYSYTDNSSAYSKQPKPKQSSSPLAALRKLNPFRRQTATPNAFFQNYANAPNIDMAHIGLLYNAEQNASYSAKSVLETVRQMALENREIVSGSCWDYLNAAFQRAGVGKETLFKGEYPYGPFANTYDIQPGDWLYYVNHSYNDGEHSGLFVGWVDRSQNQALILSYAGENRQEPARYRVYDISHIYNVMRPV